MPVLTIPNVIQPANLNAPHNIIQLAHPIQIPNAPHAIANDEESIANVFCFDVLSGLIVHDVYLGLVPLRGEVIELYLVCSENAFIVKARNRGCHN